MRNWMLGPAAALALLAAASPVKAQGQFPTPQNQQFMAGVVVSCLNASGLAVPATSADCANPIPVTLSGSISGSVTANQGAAGASAWPVSVTTWGGGTLGAMANYGTSPGAVLVPGVNAYVTNAPAVTGTVADTATATATPVNVSGVYNSSPTSLSTGQAGNIGIDQKRNVTVVICGINTTSCNSVAIPGDGATAGSTVPVDSFGALWNGATWDRQFTCPSTAVINVSATNTTELVALTSSQIIRVCSFVLTESLAGTATFVYGTGTNCATNQVAITGAMALATSGTLALSAGNGSLFRTASANALCLTAATGNITGFVTYAKY